MQLNNGDINALKRIYETNPSQFRQSLIGIQVHEAGAVEISVEGEAVNKNSSKAGPLLLPVVLVKELPDYLKATDSSNGASVELQAYKIVNGLWCITAVVPFNPPSDQPIGQTPPESKRIQLKVLLVSPNFATNLPFLLPAAQSHSSVDLSITLPDGAGFTSFEVNDNSLLRQSTKLSVLPPSITGGKLSAAARLMPESTVAWDLSQITFTNSSYTRLSTSKLIPRLLFSTGFLVLGMAFIYWLKTRYFVRSLKIDLQEDYGGDIPDREMAYRLLRMTHKQERLLFLTVSMAVILISVASAYLVIANGQGTQPTLDRAPERIAALGDFGMTVAPKDNQSDKVDVALDFIALATTANQGTGGVVVGTGNNTDAEMESVEVTPSSIPINYKKRQVELTVPASNISSSVLGALNDPEIQIEKVRVTDSLQATLNEKGNLIKLKYVLTKAQQNQDYIGGWLHRFPFEYRSLVIPMTLQQPAIVSKIELPRQSEDFIGIVSAKGINDANFSENNNTYRLDLGRRDSRITIPSGGEFRLEATLRRTWFQRLLLIFGPIILAIIGGYFLGFVASLPSNSQLGVIIGGLGIVALPFLMRASVFSTYDKLPNLLSGQKPTIFDVIFLLGWIIYGLLAWRIWKRRTRGSVVI
ncbi:MAG: hypothetical protein ABW007_22075 [Chitinophagaceae bacterium]